MKREHAESTNATADGKRKLDAHNFTVQEPRPAPSRRPQAEFPPPPTNRIHTWTLAAAGWCHRAGLTATEAVARIESYDGSLRRRLQRGEAADAVSKAYSAAITHSNKTWVAPEPKWPAVDATRRQAAIESANMTLAGLWEISPHRCDTDVDAEWYVDQLFPGNPLLCVGWDKSRFTTAPREELRGQLSEMALIVPSPMSALTGPRKRDGEQSAHTLANTGPRHYLVTEFDPPKWDELSLEERQRYGSAEDYQWTAENEQAALIWHLREFAPLVMVVFSGNRSFHAYWRCQGVSEEVIRRFFTYAVSLGADPITWTRSQFVRLPEGWRGDKQARQLVYFFNPENGKATNP